MRPRKEIEKEVINGCNLNCKEGQHYHPRPPLEPLLLEVLLDIRDLLDKELYGSGGSTKPIKGGAGGCTGVGKE